MNVGLRRAGLGGIMPKTLLLADDSVTIQKVVGISLANEDIELVTVENGDDAIAKATEVRPDIVLADIVMPGKNGYEVCEAIKTDPQIASVPVLLLTGTFEAFDNERAREVGADGHITKPFEAQALVDQVNQLLAKATPISAEVVEPPAASPTPEVAAPVAEAPPAEPGLDAGGGDAFDFFDEGPAQASPEESWPTTAQQADAASNLDDGSPFGGIDLMADSQPEVSGPAPGAADDTVLLDTTHAQVDPAFDAAVEAAAFDAPGERSDPIFNEETGGDSGFDLESADLSMASTVPEVPAADDALSFGADETVVADPAGGDPLGAPAEDSLGAPGGDPLEAAGSDPLEAPGGDPLGAPGSDPLGAPAEPDPLADSGSGDPLGMSDGGDPLADFSTPPEAAETIVDPVGAQGFDVGSDITEPVAEPLVAEETTATVIEDVDPVALQSPPSAEPAPAAGVTLAEPVEAPAEGAPATSGLPPQFSQQLHETLEKIAWESFGELSEQFVKQALERVEAIAWEVIPQMAEAMIREELAKMTGEGDGDA